MFSKISRYRKLLDIVTTDAKGRNLESKSLLLLPEVSGNFLHSVEEVDRPDHLAYKYYKQTRKWWRICDANPEFMSPQALLGKEPIITYRFPLSFSDNGIPPPWAELISELSQKVGVENIQMMEKEVELIEQEQEIDGEEVTVLVPRYENVVIVTYNRMNLSAKDLADIIIALGFDTDQPEHIGRIGKSIIIPPDIVE